jgi:preprotein translocase subunit SecG
MSGIYTIILVIHTILVLFLIGMVLIQRSDSDGFGLGGGGMSNFMTGRSAANAMTRTTAILAGLFICTSLLLASMTSRMASHSIVDKVIEQAPAKEATTPPAAAEGKAPADATKLEKTAPAEDKGEAAPAKKVVHEKAADKPAQEKAAEKPAGEKAAEPMDEAPAGEKEEAPQPADKPADKAPSVPRPE